MFPRLLQHVQQQVGQQEVAEVVELKVELKAVLRLSLWDQHGSSCTREERTDRQDFSVQCTCTQHEFDKHQSGKRTVVNQNMEGETSGFERLNKLSHRFQRGQVQEHKLSCQQKNMLA